jgi:hypothetical protein
VQLRYVAWHTRQGFIAGLVVFFLVVILGAVLLAWLGGGWLGYAAIAGVGIVLALVPFVVDQRALRRRP